MIIDEVTKRLKGQRYDKGGYFASQGKVNEDMINELMSIEYINAAPPKTTGREFFGSQFVDALLNKWGHLAAEDIYRPLDKEECSELIKNHYAIDGNYILYVGGFSPRKNIVGLIEAFSKLITKYKKDIKLVIAGKQGMSYSIYKKKAQDLGVEDSVLFPGFIEVDHLPQLYNASKLLAYPSFYEGFGLPPVEAMACGVPVITSNVTSIPEIVQDGAITLDPNNIDLLTENIYNVLTDMDLQRNLIEKGLRRAYNFSWKKTAIETIKVYEELM
jgi:glycosyltransferase involved in cell wall biosynthesis